MTVPNDTARRKLLVSYKSFSGQYDEGRQTFGYKLGCPLSKLITSTVYTPGIFKNGYRAEENFLSADWCILDFDGSMTIEQAEKSFSDFQYIIAPTKSHAPDHEHCFRVCIPFEREIIDLDEFRYNMRLITKFFESDPLIDGARFYWPSTSIHRTNYSGEMMEVTEEPPYEKAKRIYETAWKLRPRQNITERATAFLENGSLCSEGRNCTIRDISRDLVLAGWDLQKIVTSIEKAPFSRDGFFGSGDDIERIVTNSFKYVERKRHEQRKI